MNRMGNLQLESSHPLTKITLISLSPWKPQFFYCHSTDLYILYVNENIEYLFLACFL